MADEARLNELLDLVEQARAEGDTATEQKAVAAYRRESAPPAPVPTIGGMGGYNPLAGRLMGAQGVVNNALGISPQANMNPVANAAGPLEMLAQAGTGALAAPTAGLAGIGQGIKNIFSPGMSAADRVNQVQQAMTYQPRTAVGAGMSNVVAMPGQAYSAGTNYLGEKVTDLTGSPALGAALKTTTDIAPALLGLRRAAPARGPKPKEDFVSTKNDVPTTPQLKSAAQQAYKEGEASGVIVPAEGYADALTRVQSMAKTEGLNAKLHPKSSAVMEELEKSAGKPLTLQEAETLRKIALDAEDDLNPVTRQPTPDARLAGKIVDELDDSIDALSVNNPARELWKRSARSQMIDRAIARAEIKAGAHYTQAGMEHALRQEFKQLALNERRMRGLNKEQRDAIKRVATGGPLENSLRALGKFDPTTSPVAALSSLGTSALLTPINPLAAALPLAGFGSKRLATKMTSKNVDLARELLVGRGLQPKSSGSLSKAGTAPLTVAATGRTPQQLRAEIASLDAEVFRLQAMGPAANTVRKSVEKELARLQRELAAAEALGE